MLVVKFPINLVCDQLKTSDVIGLSELERQLNVRALWPAEWQRQVGSQGWAVIRGESRRLGAAGSTLYFLAEVEHAQSGEERRGPKFEEASRRSHRQPCWLGPLPSPPTEFGLASQPFFVWLWDTRMPADTVSPCCVCTYVADSLVRPAPARRGTRAPTHTANQR